MRDDVFFVGGCVVVWLDVLLLFCSDQILSLRRRPFLPSSGGFFGDFASAVRFVLLLFVPRQLAGWLQQLVLLQVDALDDVPAVVEHPADILRVHGTCEMRVAGVGVAVVLAGNASR